MTFFLFFTSENRLKKYNKSYSFFYLKTITFDGLAFPFIPIVKSCLSSLPLTDGVLPRVRDRAGV